MLLQALHQFYNRACRDNLIQESAFASKPIRWTLSLDAGGNLVGVGETADERGKAKLYEAPRTNRPMVSGLVATFLADGMDAVFGLNPEPYKYEEGSKTKEDSEGKRVIKHKHFWQQIERAADETNHLHLRALLSFFKNLESPPDFFRSETNIDANGNKKHQWWIKTATGNESKFAPADNFTFEVDHQLLIEDDLIRQHWRKVFQEEALKEGETSDKGVCLVTGEVNVPIMRSHRPLIKRVPGGKQQDRYLVSFEGESFTSYGQKKSYNAPVSVSAVEAYCHALNYLLSNKDHSFTIGDTVLCFWASETDEVTQRISGLLNRPRPQSVRAFMESPRVGDSDRAPLKQEDFYSVTLSGNAGRVVVRHWMQMTVKQAMENFRHWFEDLNIVAYDGIHADSESSSLSIFQLALTTVRQTKEREKKFEPEMLTQLYRAALEKSTPSLMLAKKIVDRFAVELMRDKKNALNLSRFALLRLIINRNRKGDEPMIEPILSVTDDTAYNCGRLLAIFDELQWAAQGDIGAGVVERYYGAASSAPNTAFGTLWRLHQHHLKKLARTGDGGRAKAEVIKRKIEEIACRFRQPDPRFPPEFPRAFDMRAQGRFALGFYQQKAAERQARTAYLEARKAKAAAAEEQTDTDEPTSTQGDSNNE